MEVRGHYILEKPLVIDNFELKTIEDEEKGTRYVAQLTVQGKDFDIAEKYASQELERIFKAITLAARRGFEFQLKSATEITPDKLEEREHMGFMTITFPFVEVLKLEQVEQLHNETQEILRLMHKTDPYSEKAIEYFMIGTKLSRWPREAFLSFFKAIELISNKFLPELKKRIKEKIPDLEPDEISRLATSRRKILNVCEILGIEKADEKIDTIVRARDIFDIAHATLKKTFRKEYGNDCRELAGKIIVNYMKRLQNTTVS